MKKLLYRVAAVVALSGLTTLHAGNIVIVNGSSGTSEPTTTSQITANLQTLHEAVGNTVTVVSEIPVDLSPYGQVWDIRFSNVFELTVAQRAQYGNYLASGGGMFVMGENSGFMPRNNSVIALINEAGGGSLNFTTPVSTQDVLAPFTGPNPVTQITYAAPGGVGVGTPGTGSWITKDPNSESGTGVAWGVGDLVNAPAGALTVIFDVNFMQNQYDVANSQNLTKNLIQFVGDEVDPVPEPVAGTLLALMGLCFAGFYRSRLV